MGECAAAAAAAKTSVWWDIDRCAVPRGRCDPHRIAHNVIAALAAAGYAGPVSIAAYGDAARVAPPVLHALSATGICINHVPAGSKDTSDKRMLVDMLFWAFDNPPPGNYLVISGDRDFSDLLHRLRMKRYDILVVRPSNASSQVLAAAAKSVWLWETLAAGEMLQPESPRANTVLGCKMNVNNSDTLKRSQSTVHSEYGRDEGNANAGSQYRVKPLQKYVKKASSSSSCAGNQGRVESIAVASGSCTGSTVTQLDQSSISSSSSSNSDSCPPNKVNTSVPLKTAAMTKSSDQKPALSMQSRQVEATHEFILGKKPSTSAEYVARNGILGFGVNKLYKQTRDSEEQRGLHSEFKIGDNNGNATNRHRVKPLQKYVKKTNITRSTSSQIDSVGIPHCPIRSTTSELDQSSFSSSSSSNTLEVAKSDNLGLAAVFTLSHSSAQRSMASTHLHQMRVPHEFILGKKLSTSVEHTSRNGTHDSNVNAARYHPTYQQSQSSEAQNKLQSYPNMGDNGRKLDTEYKPKPNQHQVYVKKIDISSASASNEIDPVNGFIDPKGSTLGHPSHSMSASSSSKSLESTKVNQSSPLTNPLFSLSSANKPVMTDHLHQEGAASIFGKEASTSFQCTAKNGTFVFGASIGSYHSTYRQTQSSLLPEQHKSGIPHPHSVHGHSHLINSHRSSYAPPSAGHDHVSFAQIQGGSTVEGLDDICRGIGGLNISERSEGTSEARPPFHDAPASVGMPDISGRSKDLPETGSSLNNSSDPPSDQFPSSDFTCSAMHPPNLSSDMQNPGCCEQKPGYPPDSFEAEGTIRHILHALGRLKTEKLFPTESNIADCIRYGEMNLTGFDVKKALELAIRHEAVVMKKLVNDMPLFVAKDESLWKCVNVTNSKAKNPTEELDTVHKYISSTDGRSAIKNSQVPGGNDLKELVLAALCPW
ncbi:hypothetical protein ACP70R_048897 [Stipagrostis hirtigluma subsp. patula]